MRFIPSVRRLRSFLDRHIGPRETDVAEMCRLLGVSSVDQLVGQTIPEHIRLPTKGDKPVEALAEHDALAKVSDLFAQNNVDKSCFIGGGYYGTHTPAPIQRNLLENPGWYTAYTPYQAEISQGRMESLLNFQTLVTNLTGMDVSNCGILDEATAAAESAVMMCRVVSSRNKVFVSDSVFGNTARVLKTRCRWLGIELEFGDINSVTDFSKYSGVIVQLPDKYGSANDYSELSARAHKDGALVTMMTDLMYCVLGKEPGAMGADIVAGTSQRFGVPLLYGGPHAAYLATKMKHIRRMPGRIIGVSKDAKGQPALRLTLQTREQHIRLDKATSNICTAQALLANMAAMFAVYHGPKGLQEIASRIHGLAMEFSTRVSAVNSSGGLFDTVSFKLPQGLSAESAQKKLRSRYSILTNVVDSNVLSVSFDETHTKKDLDALVRALGKIGVTNDNARQPITGSVSSGRTTPLLPHKVFNSYHSETELMRYLNRLQDKDLSLTRSMITLGSCTMKLNSASSLAPVTQPGCAKAHPLAPKEDTQGFATLEKNLAKRLCEITGMDACSLQPMSGASGEYAGLLAIRLYHQANAGKSGQAGQGGQGGLNGPVRDVALIPRSAHGTNAASAAAMGLNIAWVEEFSDKVSGGIDTDKLKEYLKDNGQRVACIMMTYPSTHTVFDEDVKEVIDMVHEAGGLVYMDGANMNAQLGLTSPGHIGADVCHLNLHKTFGIPHGGGGPGMGPICVKKLLVKYLPGTDDFNSVSGLRFGQAGVACIPYMFTLMLGSEGIKKCGEMSILNANYMMARLKDHYPVKRMNDSGRVSHEFILDLSQIRASTGITEEDIAKRLMDYGFHAPTMSWPIHQTLMIEPTESESKEELDRFCDAMISIRKEIQMVQDGKYPAEDNPLKNAPHTVHVTTATEWNKPYTRETAAFPAKYINQVGKYWPTVSRVDNSYGDTNLHVNWKD